MTSGKVKLPVLVGVVSEADVESASGIHAFLEKDLGYQVRSRKSGNRELDAAWPSKTQLKSGPGKPDFLLYTSPEEAYPAVVWENKGSDPGVDAALLEAKGYVEGAHQKLPGKPGLPRIAAGYDGTHLKVAYLSSPGRWIPLKLSGVAVQQDFPGKDVLVRGVRSDGNIVEPAEALDAATLRSVLDQLKTVYRNIPALSSGRRPIDFTIALLTLRMIVERQQNWGSWSEQPSLVLDEVSLDSRVNDRFATLAQRVARDPHLKLSYGSIFKFAERDDTSNEVAFDFEAVLKQIPSGRGYFERMFTLIDTLPALHGADIDIFGEVYQAIGDDSVRRAFGEYFTGRHIIAGVVPVFFARANVTNFSTDLKGKAIADIACGTGGFLTETLRFSKRSFDLDDNDLVSFAQSSFYGYDLSVSNASRARVNMYFAGDGFSVIDGGVDSLATSAGRGPAGRQFDFILTNPPYGSSSEHHLIHEAFLSRTIDLLKPGGWALIVLPTGTLENPRSSTARFNLLQRASVTDVIALPRHAFAPYTTQRTAIVILRRRADPIAATTWDDLIEAIADEKISMFKVTHDGFANSDKRFPTKRKASNGSWLHDDLAQWNDRQGRVHPGAVYGALINERKPTSEERKYARFSMEQLRTVIQQLGADRGSGLDLLPDAYLRQSAPAVPTAEFLTRTRELKRRLRDITVPGQRPFLADLQELLAAPLGINNSQSVTVKLDERFDLAKGNQALTEAVMYGAHDPNGLPVYGGGATAPSYFVRADTKTAQGSPLRIFSGPAIVLSMDGSSGAMRVVEDGEFACNHHALVLTPKQKRGNYLHLFAQQAQPRLKLLASNQSASSTLTVGMVESLEVTMPSETSLARTLDKTIAELQMIRAALV